MQRIVQERPRIHLGANTRQLKDPDRDAYLAIGGRDRGPVPTQAIDHDGNRRRNRVLGPEVLGPLPERLQSQRGATGRERLEPM
jgi:hypothetical protein